MARSRNPFADPAASPQLPYGTVEPEQALGGRYKLAIPLTNRDDITLWEGYDETLSRPVLIWVIPPNHRRTEALLGAARDAATATDARFLRVLDVLEYGPIEPVSCIVSEYEPGCRLQDLLAEGPLSGLAAAWVTAQLAGALAPLHAQDLFHQRLSPATVILTPAGNVRIAGFLLDAAVTPREGPDGFEEQPSRGQKQRADLDALGQIFYASLCAYWPLLNDYEPADLYGLPPAPRGADGLLATPASLRPGMALNLDTVCIQTLEPRPDSAAIRRAADLASVLGRVLGTADASDQVAARVRSVLAEGETAHAHAAAPVDTDQLTGPTGLAWLSTMHWGEPGETSHDAEATPTGATTAPMDAMTDSTTTGPPPPPLEEPAFPQDLPRAGLLAGDDGETSSSLLPGRPHLAPEPRRLPVWLWGVVAVLAVALVLLLIKACSAPPPPAQPLSVPIAAGRDFDPAVDGGNGEENPGQLAAAFDGDPATSWSSLTYYDDPQLGGLKPGVGLVLDLGQTRHVTSVTLTLDALPVTVEVRAPTVDPTGAQAPMDSQRQWTAVVDPAKVATSPVTLTLATPADTRWLLVYFTSLAPLPDRPNRFHAVVAEVSVDAMP